jgi:microcin C transport system permease protein
VIIISSIIQPTPWLLVGILAVFSWIGISYYVRGEFYREKAKDYVAAAVATGESDAAIIFRHILPNTLTPVISTAPFALIGGITALVSLDFLGFGVPAPTPSWGELMHQGRANLTEWHLVLFPLGAQFVTLLMVVFIGEAVREAFDPKTYSRLR